MIHLKQIILVQLLKKFIIFTKTWNFYTSMIHTGLSCLNLCTNSNTINYPKLSKNNFIEIINHHKYCARQAASSNYFLPGVDKRIAQKQLSFRAGVGNLRPVGQIRPVDTFYSARSLFSRLCIYPARDLFT